MAAKTTSREPKNPKTLFVIFITMTVVSLIVGGIMLYNDLRVVDLDKRETTFVTGTIESFQNNSKEYEIHIEEDDLTYNIHNVYRDGFAMLLFEQEVVVGDNIELIVSDYRGSSTFQSEPITAVSIYALDSNSTEYMTFQDSVDIYYENKGSAGPYIVFIFSAYAIGGSIYSFLKMKKNVITKKYHK